MSQLEILPLMVDPSAPRVRKVSRVKPWAAVAVCTVASGFLYLVMLREVLPRMPSAAPTFAGEVLPWVPVLRVADMPNARATSPGDAPVGMFCAIVLELFGFYLLMMRALGSARDDEQDGRRARLAVWLGGAALLAVQLTGPAMLSEDAFGYAASGRMLSVHHLPYWGERPEALPPDPFANYQEYGYIPSPYGMAWALGAGAIARIGGEHVGLTLLMLRGASALAVLAAAWGIERCLRRVSPARVACGLAFFLFNPLVLTEFGLSGHNDAWMLAPMMAGLALALSGRWIPAGACLAMAVMIKTPALPVAMLCAAAVAWHGKLVFAQRWRAVGAMASGALVTWAIVYGVYQLELSPSRHTPLGEAATLATETARSNAPLQGDAREVLVGQQYVNSLHEMAWKRLLQSLGERPETIHSKPDFSGWWLDPLRETEIRSAPSATAPVVVRVKSADLMIVDAEQSTEWAPVYLRSRDVSGFVHQDTVRVVDPPAQAASDPVLRDRSLPPKQRHSAVLASNVVHGVTLGAFAIIALIAAWRVRSGRSMFEWSTVVMLSACYLIAAWFWPWYATWALAAAAVVSEGVPAKVAGVLSCTVLAMYAANGASEHVYELRSLFMFVPPLLAWIGLETWRRRKPAVRSLLVQR
jgi:hypothetical protein